MERHDLLAGLHRLLHPRSYLEIGVAQGASLAISRAPSVGIDPAFSVHHELNADIQLIRATSDDYFSVNNPTERLGGVPIDLAFIDGMHLAEFAMRDFMYVEAYTAPTSVIVFDDMLPRNVAEAARKCHTIDWTGDVFKVTHLLRTLRPDLVVLEVDTDPTGTVVVLLPDGTSSLLLDNYPAIEAAILDSPDPQEVPERVLYRTEALDPAKLLDRSWWATVVDEREGRVPSGSVAAALASEDWGRLRSRGAESFVSP